MLSDLSGEVFVLDIAYIEPGIRKHYQSFYDLVTMNVSRFNIASHECIRCLVLVLVFTPCAVFGALKELVIDTDAYHYEATFDDHRVSEARLRELLPFSPYIDIGDGWKLDNVYVTIAAEESPTLHDKSILASPLETCIADDPRYRSCGAVNVSDPNFLANAQINVESNAKVLAAVDRLQVPSELRPILKHYRDAFAFSSMLEQRRLEYLRSGDLRVLSMQIGAVNPSQVCSQQLKELQLATMLQERYGLSHHSWHNCVVQEWRRTLSGYPISAWRSFLAAYGITERFRFKSVD